MAVENLCLCGQIMQRKKCVIECINEQLKSSTFMTHVCAQFYN